MPATWAETRNIPLAELTLFPGNARRGDIPKIAESLAVNGQYRSLVVRDTGGAFVILAGNHTAQAVELLAGLTPDQLVNRYGPQLQDAVDAAETDEDRQVAETRLAQLTAWSGMGTVRCELITCTDAEARRINLADNRVSELGGYDDEALAALLADLDGDLEGTGFSPYDLDELSKLLNRRQDPGTSAADREDDFPDDPDFGPSGGAPVFSVVVNFATDEDADEFFELIGQAKGRLLWWPELPARTADDGEDAGEPAGDAE